MSQTQYNHVCAVLLIWTGHAPFYKHTHPQPLVEYLEVNILPKYASKDTRKGQNELLVTRRKITLQACMSPCFFIVSIVIGIGMGLVMNWIASNKMTCSQIIRLAAL